MITRLVLRLLAGAVILALMAAALGCIELGRRLGRRRLRGLGEGALDGFSTIEGSVFGLLGLLLAFTFSAAAARYDARRELIVKEANAIGTAYLRLDLLPTPSQLELRRLFGQYLDARLAIYQGIRRLQLPDGGKIAEEVDLQNRIWRAAVAGCEASGVPETMLAVLPAINDMIDITTERGVALHSHVPALVVALLVVLVLAGSTLAGYGMARVTDRSWAHVIAFVMILAVTIYVILDYEFPRLGLIRLDRLDLLLVDLRRGMP